MKVKALKTGFFNGARIREGQEIEVPEGTKASWLLPLEEFKAAPKAKTKAQPETLSAIAKAPAVDSTQLA